MKKGSKHKIETIKRLSEMLNSYKKTDKYKKALKDGLNKQKGNNHPMFGRKHTNR